MYLAVCICLGVFDDVLKLQSGLQQHWLLTGDHLLVNGVVEVGHLHIPVKGKRRNRASSGIHGCSSFMVLLTWRDVL